MVTGLVERTVVSNVGCVLGKEKETETENKRKGNTKDKERLLIDKSPLLEKLLCTQLNWAMLLLLFTIVY